MAGHKTLASGQSLSLLLVAVALLAGCNDGRPAYNDEQMIAGDGAAYLAHEVILRRSADVDDETLERAIERLGGEIVDGESPMTTELGYLRVQLPGDLTADEAISRLQQDELVESAERNYIVEATEIPDDARWAELWGMEMIDAPAAWEWTTGNTEVIVAVSDTGVDVNHEDLSANIWTNPGEIAGNGVDDDGNGYVDDVHGWDWVNNDADPSDDNSHGTHCAGTIGGVGNNGAGVAGVNWTVRIMALKFLSASGSGSSWYGAQSILYAAQMGARVVSASWGHAGTAPSYIVDAIDELGAAGGVFVSAAGNNATDIDAQAYSPGSLDRPNQISVAASTPDDELAYFSNYGATRVHVAAPGTSILSTVPGGYGFKQGTSMATPHVAGAVALLLSVQPGLSPELIRQRIIATCDPVAALVGRTLCGGRLNVHQLIVTDSEAPAPPEDFTATAGVASDVVLSWTPSPDDDINMYVIEWGTSPGAFAERLELGPEVTTERVTGLENNIAHHFRIFAVDEGGNVSEPSEVVAATPVDGTAPPQVVDLTLAPLPGPVVWTDVVAASSEASPYYQAGHAVDGDPATTWMSMPSELAEEEHSLVVELEAMSTIDRITLTPASVYPEYFPVDFDVELSLDGADWAVVGGLRGAAIVDEPLEVVFPAQEAGFLRLRVLRTAEHSSGHHYVALGELTVHQVSEAPDTLRLQFTAPGDNPGEGRADHYDIRWSNEPLDATNFDGATPVVGPIPAAAGVLEQLDVTGLVGETLYYFALQAYDEEGNASPLSNVAVSSTAAVPPGTITDLAAEATEAGGVLLSWTAPGDDGYEGRAAAYEIRYSAEPITAGNIELAELAPGAPWPSPAGTPEEAFVGDLEAHELYYFAVRAFDEGGSSGAPSNVVSIIPDGGFDETPPARVEDLLAIAVGADSRVEPLSVEVSSLSHEYYSGESLIDGDTGTAWISGTGSYEEPEWAVLDLGELTPVTMVRTRPGSWGSGLDSYPQAYDVEVSADGVIWTQVIHTEGLEGALGVWDEWRLDAPRYARYVRLYVTERGLSACYDGSGCTGYGYVMLSEIEVYAETEALEASLHWVAPGDDGWLGTAAAYDLRRATAPITSENFDALEALDVSAPQPAGMVEVVPLEPLAWETEHFFALRAVDDAGNVSELSNVASIATPAVPPAPVIDLAVIDASTTSLTLQWTATGDDGYVGSASYYDLRYSREPISAESWDFASPADPGPTPAAPGTVQTYTVEGLEPGKVYTFAIKVGDDWFAESLLSNVAMGETLDGVPPAAVTDLEATPVDAEEALPSPLAVVDSSGSYSPETSAEQLLDGATDTIWLSDGAEEGEEELVHFELPDLRRLGRARLLGAPGYLDLFPVDFRLEVRASESDPWQTVIAEEGFETEGGTEEWQLGAVEASEARLVVTGMTSWTGRRFAALAELELYEDGTDYSAIRLSWTAPGDDGDEGRASAYDLRRAADAITSEAAFAAASTVADVATPRDAGMLERHEVRGLEPETTLCFALVAEDERGNRADLSNSPCATTPGLPPATITDLRVTETMADAAVLAWTAPGADGHDGQAAAYELRRSTSRINSLNWNEAEVVFGLPEPLAAGEEETFTAVGLEGMTRYYFAIRAIDEADNAGSISNNAWTTTLDDVPPSAVVDLAAVADDGAWGRLIVTWTATGDNGVVGRAAEYDLRLSPMPIDASNFAAAMAVPAPEPALSGAPEEVVVDGLDPEAGYYLALRVIDSAGNESALSNLAFAETRDEAPAAVTDLAVTAATGAAPSEATITLAWTATGDDDVLGRATSYDLRYSTVPLTSASFASASTVDAPTPASSGSPEQVVVEGLELSTRYYFALRVVDERGNESALSNVANGETGDEVPPAAVDDLSAATGSRAGIVELGWTQSGDDGMVGNASVVDVRWSTAMITSANFEAATPIAPSPSAAGPGLVISHEARSLPGETFLYVALRHGDESGNWAPLSNVASTWTPAVAPAAVSDLRVTERTLTSVSVAWTAPGDDGTTGTASGYDLRRDDSVITSGSFASATPVAAPAPEVAGTTQTATLSGLEPGATYFVALRAVDDRGTWSGLSNVLEVATADDEPPGQIVDLAAAAGVSPGTIALSWSATGDDGDVGRAASYELRWALEPVTAATWAAATPVSGLPAPLDPGTTQTHMVNGLDGEVVHYFAIRAVDSDGNAGPLSNGASSMSPPIAPAVVRDLAATAGSRSLTLSWTAPGDDGDEGQASRYDVRISTNPITPSSFSSEDVVTGVPAPEEAGKPQSMVISGLEESTTYYVALITIDDVDAASGMSNVANATTPDETAPSAPSSLTAVAPDADDGPVAIVAVDATSALSPALSAELAVDDDAATAWVSAGADVPTEEVLSLDFGDAVIIDRVQLQPHADYDELFPRAFAIALSESGHDWQVVAEEERFEAAGEGWLTWGFGARSARYVEVRASEPAVGFFGLHYAVLAEARALAARPTEGAIRLTWLAPGDDEEVDRADHYEVFRHEAAFTEASLELAELLAEPPTPVDAGSLQTMEVGGLAGETTYWWAVRAVDEAGNVGQLSAVVSAATTPVAPAAVEDLEVVEATRTEVTLAWTATGDDGRVGTADSVELRVATWPLTSESFPLAEEVAGLPAPLSAGEEELFTVDGLEPGTTYRFGLIVRDEVGTTSHLSNVVLVTTEADPDVTPPGAVADFAAELPAPSGDPLPGVALDWSSETAPDFLAAAAVDGDLGTSWSSAARADQGEEWLRIDLGEVVAADRVRLWAAVGYEALFPTAVEVRVSPDGLAWVPVHAESGCISEASTPCEGAFPATPARYVEVRATELALHENGLYYAVIAEVEVLAAASEPGTVIASWTATGDDGDLGQAAAYDLRVGGCPFDFSAATPVTTLEPRESGEPEVARISGLVPGTWCLGVVALDEAGNAGPLSAVADVVIP